MYNSYGQAQMPYYPQQPYLSPYQRYPQIDQSQNQYSNNQNMNMTTLSNGLKGRPVASIEEARASQIDLDGSLFVFPDVGNKKIYTKQINLDGTVSFNTYDLKEMEGTQPQPLQNINSTYATKEELDSAVSNLKNLIKQIISTNNNPSEESNNQQNKENFNFV